MTDDLVSFRLDGEVTIEQLSAAFARFSAVLDALHEDHGANVRWVLAGLESGSATAVAKAVPLDSDAERLIPAICGDYLQAARQVLRGDEDCDRPVLRAIRELTEVADENNPVVLETSDDEVIFVAPAPTPAVGTGAETQQTTKSLGSVRGRVEMLSQRDTLRFSIYELVNDRSVSCFPHPDDKDVMREAWGRIADVTGTITRDVATGRPLSIRRVTRVDVVDEGEPDSYRRARGALRATEPAERAVRRMRDAR